MTAPDTESETAGYQVVGVSKLDEYVLLGDAGLAMAMVGVSPSVWVALVFLAVAGGFDECSGVFRDAMWKMSIPDHLRGRMAGIELLSYAAGPPAGQLRSGAVAALTGPRFSLTSGGLACVAAVAAVCVALPSFRRYTAPAGVAGVDGGAGVEGGGVAAGTAIGLASCLGRRIAP